jgi:energy-coupling factor transporter ATP-binding protein EcfA2
MASKKFSNAQELVDRCLELRYFHPEKDGEKAAIPFRWVLGESNFVVVTGENAGGKSFFRRIASSISRNAVNNYEVIPISMEGAGRLPTT